MQYSWKSYMTLFSKDPGMRKGDSLEKCLTDSRVNQQLSKFLCMPRHVAALGESQWAWQKQCLKTWHEFPKILFYTWEEKVNKCKRYLHHLFSCTDCCPADGCLLLHCLLLFFKSTKLFQKLALNRAEEAFLFSRFHLPCNCSFKPWHWYRKASRLQ